METLLQNLAQAFNDYIEKVDKFYIENTKNCDMLFSNDKSDLFCRAIYYIVRRFLESEEYEELFIKIPVDELASKPSLQDDNFQKMQDSICHALAMAVYPQQDIEATSLSNENLEEIYYTSDNIK